MSGVRRAYLDRSPGEARAVVLLDGRPERLVIAREDDPTPRLGARYAARVEVVSARMGLARLDLGAALGTLRLRGADAAAVGERLEVEVLAEPVRGKPATVRRMGPGPAGHPGLLAAAPSLDRRLTELGFQEWEAGDDAEDVIDRAQAEALAVEHVFPNGLLLAVQPTRALTAVDVDLAETGATISVSRANAAALHQAARLLRLKASGGLAAIDLIGFPKDGRRLHALAMEAFAPDGPEMVIAALSRFGVMELSRPHGLQPAHEQLLGADGLASLRTRAQDVVRALTRQGRFTPGAHLVARCSPAVASVAAPWVAQLGPRFGVEADPGASSDTPDIRAL